jgi:glycine cleavage system transcriptional repressor
VAHFAITAIGRDRPGIVATLTGALRDLGGNLEDVSSTILRGHFAMMFVVDAQSDTKAELLREALTAAAQPLGVQVTVSDVEAGTPDRPAATHVLSVYGADHPGIVASFAGRLSDRKINITDLSCRLTSTDKPVYVMIAEVALPAGTDAVALAGELESLGGDVGVDATFAPIEVETL